MIGQTEVPAPPDNLLELGPVGVIVFGVCFVAVLVVTYLIANKRAANATKAGLLLAACCLLTACGSIPEQDARADESTRNTVGAEWWGDVQAKHAAGSITDEEFERRERKWYSWGYRINAKLGREGEPPEPGAPTEKQLAEATKADLDLLNTE